MNDSISVLTTLYNHERYIVRALQSALTQSLRPDQVVVIDDGSTDGSVSAAKSVPDPSIQIVVGGSNLGGPHTVKGLTLCRGAFIAILNSDDAWKQDKLRRQISYLRDHPNCGAVFTLVSLIDEDDRPWGGRAREYETLFESANRDRNGWLRYFYHHGNVLCASSAVVRKECFERVGSFDGRYVQLQDLDMWLRLVLGGYDIHVIQERLTNYRIARKRTNMSAPDRSARAIFSFEFAQILRQFWRVVKLDDLRLILPDIEVSPEADDSLVLFYLAIYSALQPKLHHRLFALETMSMFGGSLEARRMANRCHAFSHQDYCNFLAASPMAAALHQGWINRISSLARKVLPAETRRYLKSIAARHRGEN